jgi:homoserine O-succinyltransferase
MEVVRWAEQEVTSILCSCLATHAVVKHHHGIERQHRGNKLWGVYSHRVTWPEHPLVRDINTRFDAPHSRWNDVSREQLEAAGLVVLADSDEAGVHLAVSPDLFRIVYFQGHPEYDAFSLLKEYKREMYRFLDGEIEAPPPFPEHYFSASAAQLANDFADLVTRSDHPRRHRKDFPEEELISLVDNTWRDTGKAIINNWLGLVYQLTSLDRKLPFMEGVDPADPLNLL